MPHLLELTTVGAREANVLNSIVPPPAAGTLTANFLSISREGPCTQIWQNSKWPTVHLAPSSAMDLKISASRYVFRSFFTSPAESSLSTERPIPLLTLLPSFLLGTFQILIGRVCKYRVLWAPALSSSRPEKRTRKCRSKSDWCMSELQARYVYPRPVSARGLSTVPSRQSSCASARSEVHCGEQCSMMSRTCTMRDVPSIEGYGSSYRQMAKYSRNLTNYRIWICCAFITLPYERRGVAAAGAAEINCPGGNFHLCSTMRTPLAAGREAF